MLDNIDGIRRYISSSRLLRVEESISSVDVSISKSTFGFNSVVDIDSSLVSSVGTSTVEDFSGVLVVEDEKISVESFNGIRFEVTIFCVVGFMMESTMTLITSRIGLSNSSSTTILTRNN